VPPRASKRRQPTLNMDHALLYTPPFHFGPHCARPQSLPHQMGPYRIVKRRRLRPRKRAGDASGVAGRISSDVLLSVALESARGAPYMPNSYGDP